MTHPPATATRRPAADIHVNVLQRLHARFQRLVQTKVWGMDIHPSTQIALTALIDRTWPRGVHIGPDCVIGDHVVVLTHDLTRGVYLDTRIGARCVLEARSIVLPGLTIGDDCWIKPGAVVIRDMPAGSVAIGNPAEIRPRTPEAT